MKRLIPVILILAGLLWSHSLQAQVALDTETVGQCGNTGGRSDCNGTTSLTISHTTSAGSASTGSMAVFIKAACNSGSVAPTVSTVVYATSQNLSQTATVNGSSTARYLDLWSLAAGTHPTTGANNLVVTLSGDIQVCTDRSMIVSIFTASGVDSSTTYTATNTASGNSTGPATVTLASSGANDKGVMAACVGSTFTGTLGSGLTQEFKFDDTSTGCASEMVASSTGGTTVHSANLSGSDSWLIVAAAFKAAGGGSAAIPRMTLLGVGP